MGNPARPALDSHRLQGIRGAWLPLWQLTLKEWRSLWADKGLLAFVLFALVGAVWIAGRSGGQEMRRAPLAIVDEDRSPLSRSIAQALAPPEFLPADYVRFDEVDRLMEEGRYTFVLIIPSGFQRDLADGRDPRLQIDLDATAMSQTMLGAGYIQSIVDREMKRFVGSAAGANVDLRIRSQFNPNLDGGRFIAVMELVNNVTLLSIILAGAAVLREREHGTLEHLLVMPVRPNEIMLAKVLASGAVVLLGVLLSVNLVIRAALQVPVTGSLTLFMFGCALHAFASASLGILLSTIARSMPQLGLLMILIVLPMEMLSGGSTPRESMPELLQRIMLASPTTHFVSFAQAILYRGAGWTTVWPQLLTLLGLGAACYVLALQRFRASVARG